MSEFNMEQIPHIEDIPTLRGRFNPRTAVLKATTAYLPDSMKESGKLLPDLDAAIERTGLKSGMTVSFHHHFRNGDYVMNMVLEAIAARGIRDLTVAITSVNPIHEPIIKHIRDGVVKRIETSGIRGPVADAVSEGVMDVPVVFRSHGGRGYAIEQGILHIDVAFIGAPFCDPFGNANGSLRANDLTCGSLGYGMTDAAYADKVVIVTDHLVEYPNIPHAIPQTQVDYVVRVDSIGDANGIKGGVTRQTTNPRDLRIAKMTADVIEASGCMRDGFSFQVGAGGPSLAAAIYLKEKMLRLGVKAGFVLGGITGAIVDLYRSGLVNKILDVQSFDVDAGMSTRDNTDHLQISSVYYASPQGNDAAVNRVDVAVLAAMEIDVGFNTNVVTGNDGAIRGAIGGHQDAAAGASICIIVAPLIRGRIPTIVDQVGTITTPGDSIDVVVTDYGTCVNPRRSDLIERFAKAGVNLCTIEDLRRKAVELVGEAKPVRRGGKIVGIVTYRDGSVLDVIYSRPEAEQ